MKLKPHRIKAFFRLRRMKRRTVIYCYDYSKFGKYKSFNERMKRIL